MSKEFSNFNVDSVLVNSPIRTSIFTKENFSNCFCAISAVFLHPSRVVIFAVGFPICKAAVPIPSEVPISKIVLGLK